MRAAIIAVRDHEVDAMLYDGHTGRAVGAVTLDRDGDTAQAFGGIDHDPEVERAVSAALRYRSEVQDSRHAGETVTWARLIELCEARLQRHLAARHRESWSSGLWRRQHYYGARRAIADLREYRCRAASSAGGAA
ncbi:MAG: hypothetical protein AAF715_19510 [Myxococcota bacterium]